MSRSDKPGARGPSSGNQRFTGSDRDVEANRKAPLVSPTTPTFPGATYGFHPADQPSVPPRRISSAHSLKHSNRSATSLHTNSNIPPPIPASYSANSPQLPDHGRAHMDNATTTNPDAYDVTYGDDVAEELAWGPSHPCFPHLNPHVSLHSHEYNTTRIIRIQRDWMIAGDLAPTFSNVYPEILDPLLPEMAFRQIIDHVNDTLVKAADPFSAWNWFDGLIGLATGWFWEDFRSGGIKGQMRNLEKWMEQWNDRIGSKDGVRLISLQRTGYLSLDIQIPDPQIRVVGEDEQQDEADDQSYMQQHQHQQDQQQQLLAGNFQGSAAGDRNSASLSVSDNGQFGRITSGPPMRQ